MATVTEQERLAAVGRDYLADRERFVKFVAAIAAARASIPSMVMVTPDTDISSCEAWEFGFAGSRYQLKFHFRNSLAIPTSGISLLAAMKTDKGDEEFALLQIFTYDAEGKVDRLPSTGLAIPSDALTVFCSMLGQAVPRS